MKRKKLKLKKQAYFVIGGLVINSLIVHSSDEDITICLIMIIQLG